MIASQFRKWWRRRRRSVAVEAMPPLTRTEKGAMRRLGIEIEFSGLSLPKLCELVPEQVGGRAHVISDYEAEVTGTPWGQWGIELDFAFLKALGRENNEPGVEPRNSLEELSESLLAALARQVVPFEIVSPPIPIDELEVIDALVGGLRRAGARGTRHSPLYAFGVHLNVELPDTSAATLLAYLQAWVLLFDWLRSRCHPDLSRRISPYIEPYPLDYARLILQPDYAPDSGRLIDDYLRHNPTRNRALDMLPVFAHLDEARVRAVVDDHRVKARPALHYRLPNCQIDEPDWRWRELWRDWLQLEHLAADPERRARMATEFLSFHDSFVDRLTGDWEQHARRWLLDDDALAGR